MASTSGRTARLNARITADNKQKLLHYKGDMSEAAFVDQILTLYFRPFEKLDNRRDSRVRPATEQG